MKRWLPHLFYCSLLLGGSLFIYWKIQLINFLHRPTDETYILLNKQNRELKTQIENKAFANPVEANLREVWRMRQADSLAKAALAGKYGIDSLRSRLALLVDEDMVMTYKLHRYLPPKTYCDLSSKYLYLLAQNDSLREQVVLNYLLECIYRKLPDDLEYDALVPWISFTTLCPSIGQYLQADIFMSSFEKPSEVVQISINGQPLAMEEETAHFRHIFNAPGLYSLNVEAKSWPYGWYGDSVVTTKKTFFIHVNP